MYAYLVGHMTVMGYDILGESQLAGSPPIPEWDIPDAQFPEVTLVCWQIFSDRMNFRTSSGELDDWRWHGSLLGAQAAHRRVRARVCPRTMVMLC
jgi:hypothetical protein